jgi:peptidoglycan-associated lipoprotein
MKRLPLLLLSCVAAAVLVACGGGAKPEPPAPQGPNADSIAAAEKARQDSMAAAQAEADRLARLEAERRQHIADSLAALGRTSEAVKTILATMIHFDYDKAIVRGGDAGVLDQKVGILQANPGLRIRISGHCDERGSDEYNLALGNRRATAAKQYLVSHGIDASRIETASYGEERPIDPGHDENAWAQNRRDEFEILSGGDNLRQP